MSAEQQRHSFTLEEVARLARESTLEHGGHVATLIVEGSNESAIGPLDLPATFEARREMMYAAGEMIAQDGRLGDLKQVFFISEAWTSLARKEPKIHIRPSQDPARKEVLMVDCLNVESNRNEWVVFEMIRDAEGRLTDLVDFEVPDDKNKLTAYSPLLAAFAEGFKAGRSRS